MRYSFIIPVYKAEKYLDECINSVLCQTFTDYEIILVDDGSPDRSGEICDEYAAKYPFIKVIHQKNGGASLARNTGLLESKSEFVVFLDSDDFWTDAKGLERIDTLFEEDVDVVVFASKGLKENTGKITDDRYNYPEDILNAMDSEEALEYMIRHDLFNIHPGKRAYRRSFLIDNELFFKPGIKSEDIDYGLRVANCLPTYRFLNQKLYVYRHREGSVTHSIDEKHLDDYVNILKEFARYKYKNKAVKENLLSYIAYQAALLTAYVDMLRPDNAEYLNSVLKKLFRLMKYTNYPRTKKIALIYRLTGYRITQRLLGLKMRKVWR